MPEPTPARPSLSRLILVPALLTLAVTLLRLFGELRRWSPALFNREAGGGGALVGISWLVPVFGIWFGVRLARHAPPSRVAMGFGLLVAALVLLPLAGVAAPRLGVDPQGLGMLAVFSVFSIVGVLIALRAWPALARTLLAYSLAARVPVAVIMLFAIYGSWGTHYDAAPPGVAEMGPLVKWLWLGLLPQLTIWSWFTVVIGGVFGLAAGAIAARRARAA